MKNNNPMYINNVAIIDFSYIDDEGKLVGSSVNVSGMCSIDDNTYRDECIERIHKILNDDINGINHKVLTFSDSKCNIFKRCIVTEQMKTTLNRNHVQIDYEFKKLNKYIDNIISQHLSELYGRDITFKCKLDSKPQHDSDLMSIPFNFIRGSKNDTVYGKQNIIHGQCGYIAVDKQTLQNNPFARVSLYDMIKRYNNKIFINMNDYDSSNLTVSYNSKDRGKFSLILHTEDLDEKDVIFFNFDPTLDNIASSILHDNELIFRSVGINELYVSDSLNNAVVVRL